MASSTAVCKSQPPKARKRVLIGVPASATNLNKQQIAASDGGICCDKDSVNADMHDCDVEESSKDSPIMLANTAAARAKADAVKAKTNTPGTDQSKITRKKRAANEAVEVAPKPVKAKKEKDPNQPKRPPSAFFLFLEDFRQSYKMANPNAKGGSAQITKAGSEKWRSMADEAKEPYVKRCADMKEDYQKALKLYNFAGKDSIESTITDNAEEKCDGADDQSCEETAGSQPPVPF